MFDVPVSLTLSGLSAEEYAPIAIAAESYGFHGVWLSEHLVIPLEFKRNYPYTKSGDPSFLPETPWPDVWSVGSYIAALTNDIRIGIGVFVLPLRNPFVTARAAATVQNLSGGRLAMGVGTGWMKEEFDAVGEPFQNRGRRMDEIIKIMNLLWSGKGVAYEGQFYRFPPVLMAPAPKCPIPIFVGGVSGPAITRAARYGDGWYSPNCDLKDALLWIQQIEEQRRNLGSIDGPFRYVVRLPYNIGPTALQSYKDAGIDEVVVSPWTVARIDRTAPIEAKLDAVKRTADALSR